MATGAGRYNDILDTFTRHIAEIGYDGVNFGMVAKERLGEPARPLEEFVAELERECQ